MLIARIAGILPINSRERSVLHRPPSHCPLSLHAKCQLHQLTWYPLPNPSHSLRYPSHAMSIQLPSSPPLFLFHPPSSSPLSGIERLCTHTLLTSSRKPKLALPRPPRSPRFLDTTMTTTTPSLCAALDVLACIISSPPLITTRRRRRRNSSILQLSERERRRRARQATPSHHHQCRYS